MSKILIFGGGRQGSLIAKDLAENHEVLIADARRTNVEGTEWNTCDFTSFTETTGLMDYFKPDLIVCAVPGELACHITFAAAQYDVDGVSISFGPMGAGTLHGLKTQWKKCQSSMIIECGLAPGLHNLLIGRRLSEVGKIERAKVYVGGVAQHKHDVPFGYVASWNVTDLLTEYTTPAVAVLEGRLWETDPMVDIELVDTAVGKMEAFYSDGVRTLQAWADLIPHITEQTLRWPGHCAALAPHIRKFQKQMLETEEFEKLFQPGLDMVVLEVYMDKFKSSTVVYGDEDMSAMAKTTAHMGAGTAEMILEQGMPSPGLWTPEELAETSATRYTSIMKYLEDKDIIFNHEQL